VARSPLPRWYEALYKALGPQHWWPAETPFEVIVGAILTQNTTWANVERAIANLRTAGALTPEALGRVPLAKLARLVKPSGYFRQKARKLKAFVRFLYKRYDGSLEKMFQTPTERLREELLRVNGIGPETADSILLYAGNHPIFVVDAYTKRILVRHGFTDAKAKYDNVRLLFERHLPRDPALYNEYHALLVHVGKNWCRPREARCDACPLRGFLKSGEPHDLRAQPRSIGAAPLHSKIPQAFERNLQKQQRARRQECLRHAEARR
jgi:endonuclease-3 related protein